MTKSISTLAALFLAASAPSSAAEAGGVRLQFGGPLGSFTAHPHVSSGPGGTARYAQHSYKRHVSKPAYLGAARRKAPSIAIAQQQRRAAKVEVAQSEPRKAKVAIERPAKIKPVYTAKLDDKTVTSDAAPLINVPRTPEVPVVGTQSTPSTVQAPVTTVETVKTETAALQQPVATPTVSIAPDAEPQTDTVAVTTAPATVEAATVEAAAEPVKEETKEAAKSDSMANRICRRFSAVIAGLVEVPCE